MIVQPLLKVFAVIRKKKKWNRTEFRKRSCIYRNLYVVEIISKVRRNRMVCLINEIYQLLCITGKK